MPPPSCIARRTRSQISPKLEDTFVDQRRPSGGESSGRGSSARGGPRAYGPRRSNLGFRETKKSRATIATNPVIVLEDSEPEESSGCLEGESNEFRSSSAHFELEAKCGGGGGGSFEGCDLRGFCSNLGPTDRRQRDGKKKEANSGGAVRIRDRDCDSTLPSDEKEKAWKNNCIAKRTRSNIFSRLGYKVCDYSKYFKDDGDSDSERSHSSSSSSSSSSSIKSHSSSPSNMTETCKSEATKNGSCDEEGESVGELVKRRRLGLEFVVSPNGDNGNAGDDSVCDGANTIARRTRSCFGSKPMCEKQHGTVRHPYCLDAADSVTDSSSKSSYREKEKDNGSEMNFTPMSKVNGEEEESSRKEEEEEESSRKEEMPIGKSKKRKRVRALDDKSLLNTLVDTIINGEETLPKDLLHSNDGSIHQNQTQLNREDLLPFVFSFGDEDPIPVEKSEDEKALDELWAQYDLAKKSLDIGFNYMDKGGAEKLEVPEDEIHHSVLCSQGKHQYVLNEQIGIICSFCSFVQLEIRHIVPSFATRSGGISGRTILNNIEDLSTLDELWAGERDSKYEGSCNLSKGTVWDIIPGIKHTMYAHQQEGFEFMWRNLAGDTSLEKLKETSSTCGSVGGCVISHAPGTGKSRLSIVFLQSFMKIFPECRPVIVAPRGMLLTWEREFKKWNVDIPLHILNGLELSGKEEVIAVNVARKSLSNVWGMRIVKLYSWYKSKSILGISYSLFEKLAGKNFKNQRRTIHPNSTSEMLLTIKKKISEILLEKPGLFIFDEGHTPRNERSRIWKVLEKIKTERRIILSGTPFQNNFRELYNTLCLVRPKFRDEISDRTLKLSQRKMDFPTDKGQNIMPMRNGGRGKWASATSVITDDDDGVIEELKTMIKPFVHVHNGSILKNLPGLRDCLIVLEPLPQQKKIIENIEDIRSDTTFGMDYKVSLASIHPSLLTVCKLSEKEESAIDKCLLESLRLDPNEGVKTRFLVELIRLCEALNEKVLVFSQHIQPLSLIKDQILHLFKWSEGKQVLQMDGTIFPEYRQSYIDHFNDLKSDSRVLLASIKACCEGINLTGASRVVLLDVVWNPSVERQAISRAYRLGQEKVVYTYHLITSGTREGEKYYRQAEKDRLSKQVFSSSNGQPQKNVEKTSTIAADKILEEMIEHDKLKAMFKKILYQPKELSLMDAFNLVS